MIISGGFGNSERGVQPLARVARRQIFGLPRPLSVALEVRTEYLEATLGLVKCLESSKELIRECATMPGCCCMLLLHNHLMDSCSYVRKNTLLAAKGGCICTPLTPLNPPLIMQQWHAATTTRHSYTLTYQFLNDLQTFVLA